MVGGWTDGMLWCLFISCIIGLIDGFPVVVVVYRYVLCCAVLYEYCTAQCNAIQVGFFFSFSLAGRQDGDET